MEEVYHCWVQVGKDDAPPINEALGVAYQALDKYVRECTGESLDVGGRLSEDFTIIPRGNRGSRISCIHDSVEAGARAVGLRYEGPWVSSRVPEVVIEVLFRAEPGHEEGRERLWFGTRVKAPSGTVQPESHRAPLPVLELAREYGLKYGNQQLPISAEWLERDRVKSFLIPLLVCARRARPVVVISPLDLTGRPLADPMGLARRIVGIAPVFLLANRNASKLIIEHFGNSLACSDGTVRIYFPGLSRKSPGYHHPSWRHREQFSMGAEALSTDVSNRLLSEVPFPSSALHWKHLAATNFSKKNGSLDDAALVAVLRARLDELQPRLEELENKDEDSSATIQSLTCQLSHTQAELARLKATAHGSDTASNLKKLGPESVVNRVVERYPTRLILALNNSSRLSASTFEDLEGLQCALEFLATTFLDSRLGSNSIVDLDSELRKVAPGFFYNPHQSKRTMGRHPEDYLTHWEGRPYELTAHLGKGTSHDPRRCVRIGFAVDRERTCVVIGYLGRHQRTKLS